MASGGVHAISSNVPRGTRKSQREIVLTGGSIVWSPINGKSKKSSPRNFDSCVAELSQRPLESEVVKRRRGLFRGG